MWSRLRHRDNRRRTARLRQPGAARNYRRRRSLRHRNPADRLPDRPHRARGYSHAIGTGGRDLSGAVGGTTALRALAMLADDESTRTVVLVSKPSRRCRHAPRARCRGRDGETGPSPALSARPRRRRPPATCAARQRSKRRPVSRRASRSRAFRRKCPARPGGTGSSSSSAAAPSATRPRRWRRPSSAGSSPTRRSIPGDACDGDPGGAHVMLDLGDDAFTRGRPHPMSRLRPAAGAHPRTPPRRPTPPRS